MTTQKINRLLNIIQTILSSLAVAGISFCMHFLWVINEYIEKTQVRDDVQDASIVQYRIDIGLAQKENQRLDNRVTILEALLPESKRKKLTP